VAYTYKGNKAMRKLFTLAAVAGLGLSMFGCGETPAPSTPPAKPAPVATPAPGGESPAAPGGETPAAPATPPGEGAKPN